MPQSEEKTPERDDKGTNLLGTSLPDKQKRWEDAISRGVVSTPSSLNLAGLKSDIPIPSDPKQETCERQIEIKQEPQSDPETDQDCEIQEEENCSHVSVGQPAEPNRNDKEIARPQVKEHSEDPAATLWALAMVDEDYSQIRALGSEW